MKLAINLHFVISKQGNPGGLPCFLPQRLLMLSVVVYPLPQFWQKFHPYPKQLKSTF